MSPFQILDRTSLPIARMTPHHIIICFTAGVDK